MLTLRLADLAAATAKPAQQPILPEAAVARLEEAAPRFTAACPFQPGHFVTPRADGPYPDAGQPHLVLSVDPDDGRQACGHTCWSHGETFDLRLIRIDGDGDILPMRGPHWAFEPWAPADEQGGAADEVAAAAPAPSRQTLLSALVGDDPLEVAVCAVEVAMDAGFGLRNIAATVQARRDDEAARERLIRDVYQDRAVLTDALIGDRSADGGAANLAQVLGDLVVFTEAFAEPEDWAGLRERVDRALADHHRAVELAAIPVHCPVA